MEESKNRMREIRIAKIVLNIGCGTKLPVENARIILERISGKKPVITKTHKRSTFNVPKNKPIGCKVTVRINMEEFLKRLLAAKENKIKRSNIDDNGNLAFGIPEYIEIPGMEYEPKIGVFGLDVVVNLERPGFRVNRKRLSSRVGEHHRISKNDTAEFLKNKFNVNIEE